MMALWLLAAYLVGSLPFSYLIVRWSRGVDVRSVGSGNAGATNVLRAAGWGAALTALAGDVLKGAAPVWVAADLGAGPTGSAAIGLAAVLGHVFPVFLGFRGGKGVATAGGAYLALCPVALALTLGVFALFVAATRIVSVGSLAAAVTYPFAWLAASRVGWTPLPEPGVLGLLACLAGLVFWTHRGNVARLRRGEERRLGEGRS